MELPEVPKIIWTYWHSDDLPEIINKSIENWKHHSPNYEVRVVTPSNLKVHLPEKDFSTFWPDDFVQRRVDLIRLYLISKYGGIWSDASIAVKKNHDEIIGQGYDFMGYYREAFTKNPKLPVIENWFFAAPPGSEFVTKWRDELARSSQFSTIQEYLHDLEAKGVDFQGMSWENAEYMTPYLSAQYVLMTAGVQHMKLDKSDDGPFKHSSGANWNPEKAMKWLCDSRNIPDVVKVYGNERRAVEGNESLKCMYKIFD